ncbi:MAG: hypothetical protein ACT443_00755 [Gemmatimonadota bacterium]
MITRCGKFAVIVAFAFGGCNRDAHEQQEQARAPGPQQRQQTDNALPPEQRPPRQLEYVPREKKDSIRIEGASEAITLRLVQPAADLPFLTYVPSDMVLEPVRSAEGEAYYFYANFGGRRNDNAYLLVFIFPAGTQQGEALERVNAFAASRGAPLPADYEHFTFRKGTESYAGSIDLRQHGSRFYYIAYQYPVEYADGFGPRARKIMAEWRWLI